MFVVFRNRLLNLCLLFFTHVLAISRLMSYCCLYCYVTYKDYETYWDTEKINQLLKNELQCIELILTHKVVYMSVLNIIYHYMSILIYHNAIVLVEMIKSTLSR